MQFDIHPGQVLPSAVSDYCIKNSPNQCNTFLKVSFFSSVCVLCFWRCMCMNENFSSLQRVADDGAFLSWWPAKKNNSKRSTILQHLLAEPHQQMLQNSSALEIKGSVVRRRCKGWEIIAEMGALGRMQPYCICGTYCICGKKGRHPLFSVLFHTDITLLSVPFVKTITQYK